MGLIDNPQMRLSPDVLTEIAEAVRTARLDTRVMEVAGHRVLLRLKPQTERDAAAGAPRTLQIVDIVSVQSASLGFLGKVRDVVG